MRHVILFSLAVAVNLTISAPAGYAQQSPRSGSNGAANRSYFTRVMTGSQSDPSSSTGYQTRLRSNASRSFDGVRGLEPTSDTYRGESDPLRPYATSSREITTTRPYERSPVVSPVERPAPAPAPRHDFYPSLRTGQSANHNLGGRAHCVPNRGALLRH